MALIPLRNTDLHATVDDADFERVNQWRWYKMPNGYAASTGKANNGDRETLYMHRLVAGTPRGLCTDHRNGNRLDNRRENLRVCTKSENGFNRAANVNGSSGFKGVTFCKFTGKWRAQTMVQGKMIHIGRFSTPREAAIAHDIAAARLHGAFAKPNAGELVDLAKAA